MGPGLRREAMVLSLRAQQIDLEMQLACGEAGAAGALVEPNQPGGAPLIRFPALIHFPA
jgi:hypothetical protein